MKRITLLQLTGFALVCSPLLPLKASESTMYHFRQDAGAYVTKTGVKYHKSDYRYLSQSKISIAKKKAHDANYSAYYVCKP